jgi:hypothetical protein
MHAILTGTKTGRWKNVVKDEIGNCRGSSGGFFDDIFPDTHK